MKFFEKRIKPVENLTFVAIVTAVTVAFFAMLNFIPFSFIIIVLFFPFVSFLVGHLCKKRYFILYFFASILLSLTFAFYDISNLLFYLIPSLIAGFFMSILAEKKISIFYQILLSGIIIFLCSLISLPIIRIIYEIDMIKDTIKLFGLSDYKNVNSFIYSSILFISLLQSAISYIFIYFLAPRFKMELIKTDSKSYFYGGFAAFFGILCFAFSFFKVVEELNFILFIFSIYFLIMCLFSFKYKSKLEIFAISLSVVLAVIIYVLTYSYVPVPNHICTFAIIPFFYGIYFSINRGIFTK